MSLSRIGLYSNGIVELSISGLSKEHKRANVRLEMMLTETNDPSVAQAAPTLATGMKWTQARCSSTGTLWGGYSNRGVVLAFGPAHQPGARLVRLRDVGLWCRRYVSRRRQQGLRRPSREGKTRSMDEMGGHGEEKDLLERDVGDGDIQSELHHQGFL